MLFDLQAAGRRRFVKVVYVFLAVLIGGGLVLFGVGGSGFGLLNADQNSGNGGSGGSLDSQAKTAEKNASVVIVVDSKGKPTGVKRTPDQQAAQWAAAAKLRFQAASAGFDTANGQYTLQGKQELAQASTDWQRYLALVTKTPDLTLAQLMAQAYGPGGLNDGKSAVQAWQVVVTARPTGPNYSQLAIASYLAGENSIGDQAAAKALALSPASTRGTLKNQFISAKAQYKLAKASAKKQASQGSAGSALGG